MIILSDQVFLDPADPTNRDINTSRKVWRIIVGGKLHQARFNSKGSALAGLETEKRRLNKKVEA
jgi:hypothetical protein